MLVEGLSDVSNKREYVPEICTRRVEPAVGDVSGDEENRFN